MKCSLNVIIYKYNKLIFGNSKISKKIFIFFIFTTLQICDPTSIIINIILDTIKTYKTKF